MQLEIAKYVVTYFSHLMTTDEREAFNHLIYSEKLDSYTSCSDEDKKIKMTHAYREKELLSDSTEVLSLLKHGGDEFICNTARRILADNRDGVSVNTCPKCGMLARTPEAKQCRHCSHNWR